MPGSSNKSGIGVASAKSETPGKGRSRGWLVAFERRLGDHRTPIRRGTPTDANSLLHRFRVEAVWRPVTGRAENQRRLAPAEAGRRSCRYIWSFSQARFIFSSSI